MINETYAKEFCCEDISKIENYQKAVADSSQMWHCHHRNGIAMNMSKQQLKKANLYYQRPASELVFMTEHEHKKLHNARRDLNYWTFKGRKRTLQNRINISNGIKATITAEIAYKHGNGVRQTKWWNNGIKNIRAKECPDGFMPGRMKKRI